MRLHVIARGKLGRSPEGELVARYARRIAWPLILTELPERGGTVAPGLTPGRTVVLDERGNDMSSSQFAAKLARWRDDGVREARFWIGGADGHDPTVCEGADLLLRLGAATWPHLLARAMLLEQLWRATSIIAGHPYHREG